MIDPQVFDRHSVGANCVRPYLQSNFFYPYGRTQFAPTVVLGDFSANFARPWGGLSFAIFYTLNRLKYSYSGISFSRNSPARLPSSGPKMSSDTGSSTEQAMYFFHA